MNDDRGFVILFTTRVLLWRQVMAALQCFILASILTSILLTILNYCHTFQLPELELEWLVWSCLRLILISTLVTLMSLSSFYHFPVRRCVHSTVAGRLWAIIRPQNILRYISFIVAAALTANSVLSLTAYHQLLHLCGTFSNDYCLNEPHFFLLLSSVFLTVLHIATESDVITFPVIQQDLFLQVKAQLLPLIWQAAKSSLHSLKFFYPLYYLILGGLLKYCLVTNIGIQLRSDSAVDTIKGVLDLGLFLHAVFLGTLFYSFFFLTRLIFSLQLSKPYNFSVEQTEENEFDLKSALSSSHAPIVQWLAYQDLVLLAQSPGRRRQSVFDVSLPGGHPYAWKNISEACLHTLATLCWTLTRAPDAVEPGALQQRITAIQHPRLSPIKHGGSHLTDPRLSSPIGTSYLTEPKFSSPIVNHRRDDLTFTSPMPQAAAYTSPCGPYDGSYTSPVPQGVSCMSRVTRGASHELPTHPGTTCRYCGQIKTSPVSRYASQPAMSPVSRYTAQTGVTCIHCGQRKGRLAQMIKMRLRRTRPVAYFLDKRLGADLDEVLAEAQVHIWAVEGLSHLVAASFNQDVFGVVQTNLVRIIEELLFLQEAVEAKLKFWKRTGKSCTPLAPLVAAVETSVYRICATFGDTLRSVPVNAETRKRLTAFLESWQLVC